jgi:hypothetical protein
MNKLFGRIVVVICSLVLMFSIAQVLMAKIDCEVAPPGNCHGCWCIGEWSEDIYSGYDCCVACTNLRWWGFDTLWCCLGDGCQQEPI